MTAIDVDDRSSAVRITWPDGQSARFPFLWLRDNCPSGFHPQTDERVFDLLSVPIDLAPASVERDGEVLSIAWCGSNHVSRFQLDWLRSHRPGQRLEDAADVPAEIWRGDLSAGDRPTAGAEALLTDDGQLLAWAIATKRYGLGFVNGLPDDPEAGMRVAERIGFLRETNFGRTFEVVSKPDPNNLAYTAHALPLHTDLTNQELPPGFQFLHAIANDAEGGGSLFCDGFAIAEDLRRRDRKGFDLLAEARIPMRFHDGDYDIRRYDTVIRTRSGRRLIRDTLQCAFGRRFRYAGRADGGLLPRLPHLHGGGSQSKITSSA